MPRPSVRTPAAAPGAQTAPAQLSDHDARAAQRALLLEITQIPTASGHEQRVIEFIRAWAAARPDLALTADAAGNLVIEPAKPWRSPPARSPIFITAHLDHPAFVVERIVGPATIELSFRGGVMDAYFESARIVVCTTDNDRLGATLIGESGADATATTPGPGKDGARNAYGKLYLAEIDSPAERNAEGAEPDDDHGLDPIGSAPASRVQVGDVAVWALPLADVDEEGIVHTQVCDDLAAAAAALCAYDTLRARAARAEFVQDVRLLFTRAEEIGFIGAIAACRLGTMPRGSRVIALENSRSFPDSPIGGGPIVRVGDRMSIFTPTLTAACAKRAEDITSIPASPTATQRQSDLKSRTGIRWQRKLMAGGACEATVFCAFGYQATCLCLPLGNYHNMSSLAAVQDGTYDHVRLGPPRIGREYIALSDYFGLIDLLVAIGIDLPEADPAIARLESLYNSKAGVLEERPVRGLTTLGGPGGKKGATPRKPAAGAQGKRSKGSSTKARRAPKAESRGVRSTPNRIARKRSSR
jgi:endoglucanase